MALLALSYWMTMPTEAGTGPQQNFPNSTPSGIGEPNSWLLRGTSEGGAARMRSITCCTANISAYSSCSSMLFLATSACVAAAAIGDAPTDIPRAL